MINSVDAIFATIELIVVILILTSVLNTDVTNSEEDSWLKEFNRKWKSMTDEEKDQFIRDFKSKYN